MGEAFEVVGAAPRIDDAADGGFLLQEELGVAGDAGGEVGRQRDRFVERVGVQRLGVAQRGGHRLDAGAGDVVEEVLFGERPAGGLGVGAQRERLAGSSGRMVLTIFAHSSAGGAHLRDFHEEVHADRPEEREARREGVDVDAGGDAGARGIRQPSARV